MSERSPGSREEDAWLSDAQLERCAPAETEPFQGPVPTRMISNGEYMPFPQTAKQRQVEFRVKELADKASKKLAMTRRQFLESTGGLAASFLAMNEVYGNTFFKVDEVEMFEKGAFAENATPRNLFVFDDQTHIVRSSTNSPQGLRALAQGPGPVSMSAAPRGHLGTRRSSIPIFLRIPVRRPRWPASSISASTSTGCIWKRRRASPSSATRTSRFSHRPAEARPGRRPMSTT